MLKQEKEACKGRLLGLPDRRRALHMIIYHSFSPPTSVKTQNGRLQLVEFWTFIYRLDYTMCFVSAALSLILLPVIPGYIVILPWICIILYAGWLNSAAQHSAYYLVERVRAEWDEGWRTQILRGFAKPDIVILQPSAPLQLGSDCSGNSVRCIIVHCPLQLLQLLLIHSVLAAMYSSNCSNCH